MAGAAQRAAPEPPEPVDLAVAATAVAQALMEQMQPQIPDRAAAVDLVGQAETAVTEPVVLWLFATQTPMLLQQQPQEAQQLPHRVVTEFINGLVLVQLRSELNHGALCSIRRKQRGAASDCGA